MNVRKEAMPLGAAMVAAVSVTLVSACSESVPSARRAPPVVVAEVKQETVPIVLEFVGNTAARRAVDIRARVEGFLQQRAFTEGANVKQGDLLYVIDPRQFEAELEEAEGALAASKAEAADARREQERYRKMLEQKSTSQETYDAKVARAAATAALVEANEGRRKTAKLNLEWSTMSAPWDGRIGRTQVHVGNLVGAGGEKTKLAQMVELHPIYAYFSPSDRDSVEILKVENASEATSPAAKKLSVSILLVDGSEYSHRGELTFINNVVDPDTGTLTMRATVPNPDYQLRPGQVVQVRLHLKEESALLIPEDAVGTLQGETYVLVVGKDNKVEQRTVQLGDAHDGRRVVKNGLKAGERVIAQGLQKVRAGMAVQPAAEKSAPAGQPDAAVSANGAQPAPTQGDSN